MGLFILLLNLSEHILYNKNNNKELEFHRMRLNNLFARAASHYRFVEKCIDKQRELYKWMTLVWLTNKQNR